MFGKRPEIDATIFERHESVTAFFMALMVFYSL